MWNDIEIGDLIKPRFCDSKLGIVWQKNNNKKWNIANSITIK